MAPALTLAYEPVVFVNGKRHVLPTGKGEVTLLAWLRGEFCFLSFTVGGKELKISPRVSEGARSHCRVKFTRYS
jgi:hypothetical protein